MYGQTDTCLLHAAGDAVAAHSAAQRHCIAQKQKALSTQRRPEASSVASSVVWCVASINGQLNEQQQQQPTCIQVYHSALSTDSTVT